MVVATLLLPLTPLGAILGLDPLPISFLLLIGMIVMAYVISAEIAKRIFYSRVKI
jgi:Mg2+-importing ATPase